MTATAPLTDAWAAERFAARNALNLRCVHPERRWLVWNDFAWAVADRQNIKTEPLPVQLFFRRSHGSLAG